MKSAISFAAIVVALPLLGACDRPPQPPDKSAPPEPQVQAAHDAVPMSMPMPAHGDEAGWRQYGTLG